MSNGAVNFSSDNEYYTPKEIVAMFGCFDYDPATTKEKAAEFGIQNFDTIETDGLSSDWSRYDNIWINPPFTAKDKFLKKAQEYYSQTGGSVFILLPIGYLTTKKFHEIVSGAKIYLPNGRIKFESGLGKPAKSPAFGCVIIRLQEKWEIERIKISKKDKPIDHFRQATKKVTEKGIDDGE